MKRFDYVRPATIDEAVSAAAAPGSALCVVRVFETASSAN